jgi:hypothetical protein
VWNLVSHIEGGTQAKGIPEYGARKVFEHKGDEGTGDWRKQHNKERFMICTPH